jgi:hypothetical protein
MDSHVHLSIKTVRPINGRDEALEYLRDMCTYWYEKRKAFPGTPEGLFEEMARQLPGVQLAHPEVLTELFALIERVVRMNPGAPAVDLLADCAARARG